VSRDVVPIGEAARDLIVDIFSRDSLILAEGDAEELMRWPLRRMKVARGGDIAVSYSVVTMRALDNGALSIKSVERGSCNRGASMYL
jgi:hypothetical protein